MKIKLNLNEKIKNIKSKKDNTKEYKVNTENMSAKITNSYDNVLKLEVGEKRKRKGFTDEKNGVKKYFNNLFKNGNKLSKSYYRLFLLMVILGAFSIFMVVKNYDVASLEDFFTYTLNQDDVVTASSSIDTYGIPAEAVYKEEIPISKPVQEIKKLEFCTPMNGEILKIYSSDSVIYSKTLDLWKTHDGIDIRGDTGQNVVSIEKGKIEKIYEDAFLGYTVVIDHGQGYKSSYSNLSENIPVVKGQIVSKGEIIGQISNSSIGEIKDDTHLHFMLIKDGQIVDPTYIVKN